MAYRPIRTSFWSDAYILDLERDEKLLYMYLLTNDATTQCGIYEIPLRRVEFETGFSGERIYEMFHKFQEDNKIYYSLETREIAIINWRRYNDNPSPKTMSRVASELESVKNPMLVLLLYEPSQPLIDKTYTDKTGNKKQILIKNPWDSYFLEHPEITENIADSSPLSPIIPHTYPLHTPPIPHPQYSYSKTDSDSLQKQTQSAEINPGMWKSESALCQIVWKTFEKHYGTFMPNHTKEIDAINKLIAMSAKRGEVEIILPAMMKKLQEMKEDDNSKNGFWKKKPFLPSTLVSLWTQVWEEAKVEAEDGSETEDIPDVEF